jgi:hypothetical protein
MCEFVAGTEDMVSTLSLIALGRSIAKRCNGQKAADLLILPSTITIS